MKRPSAAHTARKLAHSVAALRECEVRMSLAADAGALCLWVWKIAGDEIRVTDRGRAIFDFQKSEPVNLARFLAAVHEVDRPEVESLVQNALAHGGEYESEYRLARGDGAPAWVAGYFRVEFDQEGKPAFLRGVARDITRQKLAEDALRESEIRFRTVADMAPVMIWMSETGKGCTFFNKGWLKYTGRTMEQERGQGWREGLHPKDEAHCHEIYRAAFAQRESFTMELRLRRHDGEYRWILDTGTPRFDADGTFRGYIGSCIDIAERKQAELEHQIQSMELARVGRLALAGELAASLAHEINNPLAAMVTNASAAQRLLARGELGEQELRELLGDIVTDGHRARDVIEGIRNMVRRGDQSHALIDMAQLIGDLLRIVRADALAKDVRLVAEVAPDAGTVMGNSVQLLQVLLNLTVNAMEALTATSPEARRVVIRAGRLPEGKVFVSVRDAGPGFPEGIADRLFYAFFSTKAEGTGMGLAIARSIIDAHRGTLTAENCADGGARFTLCLPAAAETQSRAA